MFHIVTDYCSSGIFQKQLVNKMVRTMYTIYYLESILHLCVYCGRGSSSKGDGG